MLSGRFKFLLKKIFNYFFHKSKKLRILKEDNLKKLGSIAIPRVLFDLGIEKSYSAKVWVFILLPRLL